MKSRAQIEALERRARLDLRRYRFGSFACALLYYSSTFGPIVLTACAFYLLQVDSGPDLKIGTIAALTGVATALSTIGAFGKFREKWSANSTAVYSLRNIRTAIEAGDLNWTEVGASLAEVQDQHQATWELVK